MPQMRNILEIDEVLRSFLQFCDKATLARLARTAKVFSDPALDVLWETLESFAHLLKVFSPDLISWNHSDITAPKPSLNHLIVPRDWKRLSSYARRVKSWGPEDLSYIEEQLVDHIAFGRNPDYILPRLTHMEVTATTVSGVHLQTLLLCPTLESVSIWNSDPTVWSTRSMNTFFRTLADRAPKLSKLIVHWGDGTAVTPLFIDGLSDVFSTSHSDLKSINLWTPNCVAARGFAQLAQLPHLATLHLNLIGVADIPSLCCEIKDTSRAFTSLQNLFLAGDAEGFHRMLQCFGNAPAMLSMGFSVREYPKSRDLRQLFEAVASKFPGLRLLQFNVPKSEINIQLANRLYQSNPEYYHHDLTVLRPLLSMHNLAALHLELGVPLSLTDTDLFTLGAAWPTIEVLNLCSDPYSHAPARPLATPLGLLALTESCPNLQHLGLFLDCSAGISESTIASARAASHALINLDVGRSHVLEPPLLAALLSGVFPELKVFQWAGMDAGGGDAMESGEGYAPGWRQVFDLLPVFRAVRANERRARVDEKMGMVMD